MLSNPLISSSNEQREGNGRRKRKKSEQQLYPMCSLSQAMMLTDNGFKKSILCFSHQPIVTIGSEAINGNSCLLMFLSVSESLFSLASEIFKFCPAFSTGPSSLCFRKPLMPMLFPNKSGQSCTPPQKRWSGKPSDLRVTYFLLHTTVKIPVT